MLKPLHTCHKIRECLYYDSDREKGHLVGRRVGKWRHSLWFMSLVECHSEMGQVCSYQSGAVKEEQSHPWVKSLWRSCWRSWIGINVCRMMRTCSPELQVKRKTAVSKGYLLGHYQSQRTQQNGLALLLQLIIKTMTVVVTKIAICWVPSRCQALCQRFICIIS